MAWQPTDDSQLRDAARHCCYEVERAVLQGHTVSHYTPDWTHITDALLEATLGHLRLLDDFFRHEQDEPRFDDVTAQHYADGWSPRAFLIEGERDALNAQLSHLAARRKDDVGWRVADMVSRLADAHDEFVCAVSDHDTGRAAWFDRGSRAVAWWRAPG